MTSSFLTSFSRHAKSSLTAVALLLCSVLLGCIGATPLPKRTRTPEGTEVKSIDLKFLHPGQTARAEVREKLRIIDTGYEGDRFFLGRWSSSTWGGWIILAGYYQAEAAGGRVWKTGNLLVEFDDQGIVKRIEPFADHDALRVLAPVAESTPVKLDPPLEMSVNYWKNNAAITVPARIVLSDDQLDFEELSEQKKKHIFSVPVRDLRKMGSPRTLAGTDPVFVSHRIECAHDLKKLGGPHGKHINLQLTTPQLVTLMRYVSDSAKAATEQTQK